MSIIINSTFYNRIKIPTYILFGIKPSQILQFFENHVVDKAIMSDAITYYLENESWISAHATNPGLIKTNTCFLFKEFV